MNGFSQTRFDKGSPKMAYKCDNMLRGNMLWASISVGSGGRGGSLQQKLSLFF